MDNLKGILCIVWAVIMLSLPFACSIQASDFDREPSKDEEITIIGEAGSAEIYTFLNNGHRCWVVITDGQMADTAAIDCGR